MAESQSPLPTAVAPNAPDKASEPLKYEPQNKLLSTVIGIAFAIFLIAGARYVFRYIPHFAAPVFVAIFLGLSLLRVIKANFIDVQSRMIEWLAAIFFCGVLMAVSKAFTQFGVLDREGRNYLMIGLAVVSAGWSFGGAGWGWRLAKRMNETDGRRRLYFIFAAWGAVFGVIGIVMFAVAAILAIAAGYETNYLIAAIIGALLIPLVIPAYRLDKKAPLLASQQASALKPAIIDKYEPCRFGPQRVNAGILILQLTGFNLLFLPLMVSRMLKRKVPLECTELQFEQLPAPVAEFVDEYHEPLRELGYERKYYYRAAAKGGNLVTFGVMYAHSQLGCCCSITAAYVLTHQGATVYRCAFDMASRFEDQTTVTTNNSSDLTFVQLEEANRKALVMRFPEVEDPVLLHQLHCARLKKLGKPETGILPESAHSVTGLQTEVEKRLDAERKVVLSLPGVYWGTWSIVWPASLVRLHRLRKGARQEMAALGFDDGH